MNYDKKEIIKFILTVISFPVIAFAISFVKNIIRLPYANMPFDEAIPLVAARAALITAIVSGALLMAFLIKWIIYIIQNKRGM